MHVDRRLTTLSAVVCALVALGLALWAPGPVTLTSDEPNWLARSDQFRAAITDGDLQHANGRILVSGQGDTSPGVTTMWCGTLGHLVIRLGQKVGVIAERPPGPRTDQLRLRGARGVVSLVYALALGLFVVFAAKLVGTGAATVAGVLLATEPFLIGHAGVLHTDALVTMWGATAVVSYLVALTAAKRSRSAIVVAALGTGLALLTKLNALPFLGGGFIVCIVCALAIAHARGESVRSSLRSVVRTSAWVATGAAGVFVVLWPAMWVAPIASMRLVVDSLRQIDSSDLTYFRGRSTTHPGPGYYPVALLVRATPWLLAGTVVAAGSLVFDVLRRRDRDPRRTYLSAAVLLIPLPYLAVIAFTPQRYDRYALPAFPFMALATGSVAATLAHRAFTSSTVRAGVAVSGAAALVALTLVQAPYAIAYVDPLVGEPRAEHLLLLGWGEGIERLGAEIDHRQRGHCADVDVLLFNSQRAISVPCGRLDDPQGHGNGRYEYAIRYITQRQRGTFARFYRPIVENGTLLKSVRIGGVAYAELWVVNVTGPPPLAGAARSVITGDLPILTW